MSKKKKSKKKKLNKQKPIKKKVTLYNPPVKTSENHKKTVSKGKTSTKYKKKPKTDKQKVKKKQKQIQKILPKKEIESKTETVQEITKVPFFRNKKLIAWLIIIAIVCFCAYSIYTLKKEEYNSKTNYIIQTNLNNYKVSFEDKKANMTDWVAINQEPSIETYTRYNTIHIKNETNNEELTFTSSDSYFKYFGEEYYILPSNGKYEINYLYFNSDINNNLSFESDNDAVTITNNIITCNKSGDTAIYAIYGDEKIKLLDIKASSLIIERPKEFDDTKEFLTCEQYSKEENEELDLILETKINKSGYLTRAGAVEALRFMTLDLPYRVQYFYENGRYPYVDGEGRYYHKGLYLSSDKYNYLSHPNTSNKGTWGCKLYSEPYGAKMDNGLDCSGLMCWALVNAGYDPDDIRGANLLLELGDLVKTDKALESEKVKVGDFVHNHEGDSHIGMIIGIDDEYYYVAQAIWYKPNGVCISKYTKEEMIKHWIDIVLLDEYYQKDGNLTNMWY